MREEKPGEGRERLTLEPLVTALKELMNDRDDEMGVVVAVEGRGAEHGAKGRDEKHEVRDRLFGDH